MNPINGDVPAGSIVVAMSGGVDSSLAAALLVRAGHSVVGVTLQLQARQPATISQPAGSLDGVARAQAVARALGVRHTLIDCSADFEREVLRPAWSEYSQGRTPSPCLLCNQRIKFGSLLAWAQQAGATHVATGHFARIERDSMGYPCLLRGTDRRKDQSYFLAGLSGEQLERIVFPIGGLTKAEVRKQAQALDLLTADQEESQDACSVAPGESFAEMLRQRFSAEARTGALVDEHGRVLASHPGIHRFTLGQRKGLGLGVEKRLWVKSIQPETGSVVLTSDPNQLFASRFTVRKAQWLTPEPLTANHPCQVQVRNQHLAEEARVTPLPGGIAQVEMLRPVRAITPGQAAVFYAGERVLGAGWIDRFPEVGARG